jgi:hypothetical protein
MSIFYAKTGRYESRGGFRAITRRAVDVICIRKPRKISN